MPQSKKIVLDRAKNNFFQKTYSNNIEITKKNTTDQCFFNYSLFNNFKSSRAFMGRTHALSALAIFMAFAAFGESILYQVLQTNNIWLLILSLCIVSGAALIPDLDNTQSTAKSSLGILGKALSLFFRTSSIFIQTTFKTKYDNKEPNPHRGFWHTGLGCIILGLGTFLLTMNTAGKIEIPEIGSVNFGGIAALIITWLSVHLCFAGLINGSVKRFKQKVRKSSGFGIMGDILAELASFALSLVFTVYIFIQIPDNTNFWWLGFSVFLGCFIHTLGDSFTTAGSPFLSPIPIKGKIYYNIRFLPIHAGGVVENFIFIPLFLFIIILSGLKIFHIF